MPTCSKDDLRNHNLTEAFRAVSEALASDPENIAGKNLLHEIRDRMTSREAERRLQDEIARAEGLLLIGETDEALASVKEIERRNPRCAEASALRARTEAQKADEDRARRLAAGLGEVKALLRNREFEPAIRAIDARLTEFAENTELQALRKHASERLADMRRLERIAKLRSQATALIERREFDAAIHALEAGVAELRDDRDLTQLLQSAVAGKAAQEQDRAVSRIAEEAERLRRAGKLDEAVRVVEQAVQAWGAGPLLSGLLQQLFTEKKERDRRRAIDDIARQAAALLQQEQADTALAALRKCIERYGDDPEIQNLVNLAESQLRDRRRSARLKGILEEIRMLVTTRCLAEASQRVEEGLHAFPKEPSLLLERESLLASLAAEHEVRSLQNRGRVDEAPRAEQAAAETAPLWSVRLVNVGGALRRVPLALWVTGGVLAVFGILFWVLQPGPLPNPAQSPATPLTDSALRVEKPIGPDSVTVGHYFSQTLRASGNSGSISWDVTGGALPRGLSLDSKSGLIVGTPTTAGSFTFVARVSDTIGHRRQREFIIAVLKPPQALGAAQSERPGKKTPGGADQVGAASVGRQGSVGTAGSSNPAPCKSTAFRLEQYADSRTGELIWSRVLSSGFHLDIVGNLYKLSWNSGDSPIFQGSIGDTDGSEVKLKGDPLPKGVPLRVSVSPETVRLTTAPSAANCWASRVVLDSRGALPPGGVSADVYLKIKWEVFQP